MMSARLRTAALIALLVFNTWYGIARIAGFRHRHAGEIALDAAELDRAFASLNASLFWQPDDAPTYILIGRVIHLAQANGLPVKGLEGYTPLQKFGVGFSAIGRAIALNPADTWAWSSLAEMYRSNRAGRHRLKRLREITESMAPDGTMPATPKRPATPEPSPEDRLLFAAALKAGDLEPENYYYHDLLAELYFEQGMRSEAGTEIRNAFALMPALEFHTRGMDEDLLEEMSDQILEGIEKASATDYFPPSMSLRARAQVLQVLGKVPEAVAAYLSLAKLGGIEHEIECNLAVGQLYQSTGKFRESIPFLDRVIEEDPNGPAGSEAVHQRALAFAGLEEHRRAVDDLRRYLATHSGSQDLLMTLARELIAADDMPAAEKVYRGVIASNQDYEEAYRQLIALLLRQRRSTEALAVAELLRRMDPQDTTSEAIREQIGEP